MKSKKLLYRIGLDTFGDVKKTYGERTYSLITNTKFIKTRHIKQTVVQIRWN